ncbi:MAG: hypothetical protein B7X55_13980 [Rhodobacterales bacterium 34-62-10]|nr:MAG: hypothetical protein B7X55_13980 [Rhodobacterales bacterium 34-62-10]
MQVDTLILGAGAAGLMAAAHAGGRVLVVDHAKAPGEKIRISGGGRCNFTNLHASPANFISRNPHFCKSALKRYTQWDFLDLVARHGIAWHEKTLGQLFCDHSAKDIVAMLLAEMKAVGADLWLSTAVVSVARDAAGFAVTLERDGRQVVVTAMNLIVATGGKSIPKMGATGLAYDIARQFGHALTDIRPALVPLTFQPERFAPLAGVALPVTGPAILQISSYWVEGESIRVNLMPDADPYAILRAQRQDSGRRQMQTVLAQMLPGRLADHLATDWALAGNLADQNDAKLRALADRLTGWELTPTGSEGYRTAEVTLGGVDTDGLSSQSMMSKTVPGLYFIGEAVDVTGWLGGYNFQWAWSSAVAAGRDIAARG